MKDRVEAILFAAGRFVDEEHVATLLGEDIRKVKKALKDLKDSYEAKSSESSLQIIEEDGSWKMHVRDSYLDLVSKLVSDKEIAKTVLETLAVVAWKTPIMQAELIKIRGPIGYEHVGELMERGFITKEASGRSFKLKVTDKFFEYFDVEGREDIRKMFKRVEDEAAAQQQEVDRAKQTYDEQKQLAESLQKELDAETSEHEKTHDTGTAPSAQTNMGEQAKKLSVEDLVQDLEGEIKELGADIKHLREEESRPAPAVKHHIKKK